MAQSKTPMEQQYNAIKKKHPDKILLFRLGDFYEAFEDDAVITSSILNIAMTKRHQKPMCGFPYHALDQYAYKLVNAGQKVAICEQLETPKEAKGIVKRDVVSVLTKGTWADNPILDRSENCFLAVIYFDEGKLSIVFADLSTGEVIIRSSEEDNPISFLKDELTRYAPAETLCVETLVKCFPIKEDLKIHQNTLRILPVSFFQENNLFHFYREKYHSFFDSCSSSITSALCGLCCYLQENYLSEDSIRHLKLPVQYLSSDTLLMNDDTLRHLELVASSSDNTSKGTLFSVINYTKTMPGARKLRRLLAAPSAKLSEIHRQQERTEYCFQLENFGQALIDLLKEISDMERLTARLITGKILPKECLALAESLQRAEKVKQFLLSANPFQDYFSGLKPQTEFINKIFHTINPECSNTIDGSVILPHIDQDLDQLKDILQNGKNFLIKLQTEERLKTGINTLKISYNKIYGYYIEISKAASQKTPPYYIRKQSLVNSERYTIPELEEFEHKILKAEDSILKLEREIYLSLLENLQQNYHALISWADFITEVDLRLGLAIAARKNNYTRPSITNNFDWKIEDGRHPIVEKMIKKDVFVANNTNIDSVDSRILIITGPNMAGKSTYLRQNALFAVLAQIGSYIPAAKAQMGVIDKIFTRIGASDDLSSGRSTFFVEMEEASAIISQMTPNSLIIMDELGRGTSTQDGLALAWAILEYFLFQKEKKAKIFFSTHYYELTELGKFKSIKNFSMAIQEKDGKPIFLRKVIEGSASKSYGIHVAEMAGMNPEIVTRAKEILEQLENETFFHPSESKQKNIQNNLFNTTNIQAKDPLIDKKNQIYDILSSTNPNILNPLDALKLIFELKNIIE
ncbi:MAG: DNA mismatch repair protein MutS [Brevinemataceae bacterium]